VTRTLARRRNASHALYAVRRVTDAGEIRALLEPEKAYAAYALAQLDPRLFPLNEWYTGKGPSGRALVVHSRSGLGQALFATGDPDAVDVILSLHPGARFSFGSFRLQHRPMIERYFLLTRPQTMLRMAVARETFTPAGGAAQRLSGSDIAAVNRLYSSEGGPGSYRPSHIDEGVYYGVWMGGLLAAIAGTHAVSPAEGVAVVGNVFTHPRHRGRGLAKVTTSAVTKALLHTCPLVVLTVEASNDPAVRAYNRLGYHTECTLHETPLIRKEPFGVISMSRRLAAAWRGRREGKEVVVR
jgi:GNAT superfamily N-acetyltransferase